jgi:hypothetical protein
MNTPDTYTTYTLYRPQTPSKQVSRRLKYTIKLHPGKEASKEIVILEKI